MSEHFSRMSTLLRSAGCAIVLGSLGWATAALADAKPLIAVSIADQKSLFYIAEGDGIRDAAAKLGFDVKIVSANNDSSLQVSQVKDLLVQKPVALILTSQDSAAGIAGVKAANQAGVPVILIDEKPEGGEGKFVTYIATDSVKAARDLTTWMFNQMGGKGELAILHGVLGSTAEIQRTQGVQEALKKFPDIKLVAEQTANWDEGEAFKAAQNIYTAHPNVKAVFGESDAMALGAGRAAKQAGRTGMLFVGIDGFPTMWPAIKSGIVTATAAQIPYQMGGIAVEDVQKIVKGEGSTIPQLQYQDTVLINKDNVDKTTPTTFMGPKAASY
jgi:ribose transport system substrate-binding protein